MRKTTTNTRTREQLLTREQVARALPKVTLSPEEEVVIRLRYGLGLAPEEKLSFRGAGNEALEARLALMEKALLDTIEADASEQSDPEELDHFLKDL